MRERGRSNFGIQPRVSVRTEDSAIARRWLRGTAQSVAGLMLGTCAVSVHSTVRGARKMTLMWKLGRKKSETGRWQSRPD
jgi:hypothetical protein